jgi:hypothetical protein
MNKEIKRKKSEKEIIFDNNSNVSSSAESEGEYHGVLRKYKRKLKMRRLLDRWNLSAIALLCILKVLQFLKKIGFSVEESGWRKFAGVFLRKEHSKFILSAFRVTSFKDGASPDSFDNAKELLIKKLAVFLRKNTVCHWSFEHGMFRARRKKIYFTDIVEAIYDENGVLVKLIPYFDDTRITFTKLTDQIIDKTLRRAVVVFNKNQMKRIGDSKRPKVISKKLHRWAWKTTGLSYTGRRELFDFIDRILSSTFIQFEVLPTEKKQLDKIRFATPEFRSRRHPGFGLLNIVCRFFPNFEETDLWLQYHHVPVDGMPMEEKLEQLKKEWGIAGKVKYPSLATIKPEIRYYGDKVFRGKIFVNFENLLRFRKILNQKYAKEMGGSATVSSMIIWGLAHRQYFKDTKYVITTDTEVKCDILEDRNIGLIFIRPGDFINPKNRLDGFIKYQKEFNHRIYTTKYGKSESSELLEIYAMLHPFFTLSLKYLIPKTMSDLMGTAGITVLKQVEVFVSPLTDLQTNGFVALGNMLVDTEDGQTAGAVSFCARKEQIREYIKGFRALTENFPAYLDCDNNGKQEL